MKKRCKILFHDGTEQIVDADDWQRIEDQIQCFRVDKAWLFSTRTR
jgi:hypothetical protein